MISAEEMMNGVSGELRLKRGKASRKGDAVTIQYKTDSPMIPLFAAETDVMLSSPKRIHALFSAEFMKRMKEDDGAEAEWDAINEEILDNRTDAPYKIQMDIETLRRNERVVVNGKEGSYVFLNDAELIEFLRDRFEEGIKDTSNLVRVRDSANLLIRLNEEGYSDRLLADCGLKPDTQAGQRKVTVLHADSDRTFFTREELEKFLKKDAERLLKMHSESLSRCLARNDFKGALDALERADKFLSPARALSEGLEGADDLYEELRGWSEKEEMRKTQLYIPELHEEKKEESVSEHETIKAENKEAVRKEPTQKTKEKEPAPLAHEESGQSHKNSFEEAEKTDAGQTQAAAEREPENEKAAAEGASREPDPEEKAVEKTEEVPQKNDSEEKEAEKNASAGEEKKPEPAKNADGGSGGIAQKEQTHHSPSLDDML